MSVRERRSGGGRAPEPEWSWGATPGGVPAVVWEYSARPLWAQAVPERDGVLLLERERQSFRRVSTGAVLWEHAARELPDELACDALGFVLATGAHLFELDPASGGTRWRQRPGGPVTALALDERTVYAATRGPLFALERWNGATRWRAAAGWELELSVYPEAGLLLVDDPETETIRAFATATGALGWEFAAEGQPLAAGPLGAGRLLLSCYEAGLAAVDPRSGETLWRLETDGAFESPAVAADSQAPRAFATDGRVYALDVAAGAVLWQRAAPEGDRVFALRLCGDTLFAETWRGRLLALDPESGALRWERTPGQVHGLAADAARLYLRVHSPQEEGRWAVLALDRRTGDLVWELRARRMVPDLTLVGEVLLVELKTQVLALRP